MKLRLVPLGVCTQTLALLGHLLNLARKGELRGLAVCYWRQGVGYEMAFSGIFDAEPERALAGAELLRMQAARQLDLFT